MKIIRLLKDIIAPKKCYFCNTEGHFFCPRCYCKTSKVPELCYVCKEPSSGFSIHAHCRQSLDCNSLMILFPYQKVKRLIKDSKYYSKQDVLEDIGQYTGDFLLKNLDITDKQKYIILPIPMNFWRKSSRGYNHADVLAKYTSLVSQIPYNTKVLKRVKNTLQQSKLTRNQRLSNLDGAFKIDEKYRDIIKDKHIILVDDVVSTGVTFLEVLTALNDLGVDNVNCLAIASDTSFFDEK